MRDEENRPPEEEALQVTYRTQVAFAIGVGNLGVGLLVALVGRLVLPQLWAVVLGGLLQGFGVLCFAVLGRRDRASEEWPRLRRRFMLVGLWLCVLWLWLPAVFMGLAGYLLVCGTATWALWKQSRS